VGLVGLDCKCYLNTGSYGSPVWLEITIIQDLSLALDKGKAEATPRGNTWKMTQPTIKSGPLEFRILGDVTNALYDLLRDAWLNDLIADMAVSSGPLAGPFIEYFRADYYVYEFKRQEPLLEACTVGIAMDLAWSSHVPGFVSVGS